jgi:hypothetical protein
VVFSFIQDKVLATNLYDSSDMEEAASRDYSKALRYQKRFSRTDEHPSSNAILVRIKRHFRSQDIVLDIYFVFVLLNPNDTLVIHSEIFTALE